MLLNTIAQLQVEAAASLMAEAAEDLPTKSALTVVDLVTQLMFATTNTDTHLGIPVILVDRHTISAIRPLPLQIMLLSKGLRRRISMRITHIGRVLT